MKWPKIITKGEDFKSIKNPKYGIHLFPGIGWGLWGISIHKAKKIEVK